MSDYRAASLQSWSSVASDWAELTDRIDRQFGAATDSMIEALALAGLAISARSAGSGCSRRPDCIVASGRR